MSEDDDCSSDGGHPSWGHIDIKVAGMADAYNDGYQRGYEEGAKAERERADVCSDCKVQRRSGGLPCHWRADIDIAAMKEGSPKFIIIECEHQESLRSLRQEQDRKQLSDEDYAAKIHRAQYLECSSKQEREK